MPDSPISPTAALVALQFLLYAGGWGACAFAMRRQRAAALHWAGFMLATGAGFWLTTLRGEPRTWWPYAGSGIAFLAGYLLLHRGMEHFLELKPADRGHLLWAGVAGIALAAVGSSAEQASLRVSLTYGLGALFIVRMLLHMDQPTRREFGPWLGRALILPAYVLALLLGSRMLGQLLDWSHPKELHLGSQVNLGTMYGYLVGAALFNFSFVALISLRAMNWLHHLSLHDALTGLLNRRALDSTLQREWQRWRRDGVPFAVMALDLDHFKRVNDEHGHEAGDEVLVQTAEQLRRVARASDAVARPGGEEFVVLMPGADAEGARVAAERLLQRLRETGCRVRDRELVVTASAGVTQAARGDADVRDVLRRADEALYRAKADGRDRVVAA